MLRAVNGDARLAKLRAAMNLQYGLFSVAQARCAGFNSDAIHSRVDRGDWAFVAPKVLQAAPGSILTSAQRTWAAVLSADAVAARRSGCALYTLIPFPRVPEVMVERSRRNLERAAVLSTRSLPHSDVVVARGIPAVTPTRAVIDCCSVLGARERTQLVTKAIVRRLVDPDLLVQRAAELRNARRPGATRVITIVASLNDSLRDARNEWEGLVLEWSDRLGLPRPVSNFRVDLPTGPRFIDAAWPGCLVGGEFDGYWEHLTSRKRFDDDRVRRNELTDAGWKIYNLTSTMLRDDPRGAFGPIVRAVRAVDAAA
jgi:hypothetical protein